MGELAQDESSESQEALLRCRLWLWAFRGVPEQPDLAHARTVVARTQHADLRAEGSAGIALALLQSGGPDAASDDLAVLPRQRAEVTEAAPLIRVLTVEAWSALMSGDAARAMDRVDEAVRVVEATGDAEGRAWMGGAGGLLRAVCGEPRRAADLSHPAPTSQATDWSRLEGLRELTHLGNRCYVGPPPDPDSLPGVLTGDPVALLEPTPLLSARACSLAQERSSGRPDRQALLLGLEHSAACRHLAYVVVIGLECLDLAAPDELHTLQRDELSRPSVVGGGILTPARDLAQARLDRDAEGILRAGVALGRAGLLVPALRALADVTRVAGTGEEPGRRARGLLIGLLQDWEGVEPWWCPGLPSRRQREIACAVAAGRSVADLARALYLSRRTVENHLQRVYAHLGAHSREQLTELLRLPV